MKELHGLESLRSLDRPVVLAIGVFDGVHRGHRKVIETCLEAARRVGGMSAVLTFHPHPAKVVRPDSAPSLLTTESQDRHLFAALGIDCCVTIGFDSSIRQMSAEEFLGRLADCCPSLKGIVVGFRWHFGLNRGGNFEVLGDFCRRRGIEAVEVPPVRDEDGEVISSTRIRWLVAEGRVREASRLLGRPYAIEAVVERGDGRGRNIGFSTANLRTGNELIPAQGVYAVRVAALGRRWRGAMNIGIRPTVDRKPHEHPVLEVHLLDFQGDLLGRPVEVDFLERLRDEKKFATIDQLHDQIARDVESVRQVRLE